MATQPRGSSAAGTPSHAPIATPIFPQKGELLLQVWHNLSSDSLMVHHGSTGVSPSQQKTTFLTTTIAASITMLMLEDHSETTSL